MTPIEKALKDVGVVLGMSEDFQEMLDGDYPTIRTIPRTWSDWLPELAGTDINLDDLINQVAGNPVLTCMVAAMINMAKDGKHKGKTINFSNDKATPEQGEAGIMMAMLLLRYWINHPDAVRAKGAKKAA